MINLKTLRDLKDLPKLEAINNFDDFIQNTTTVISYANNLWHTDKNTVELIVKNSNLKSYNIYPIDEVENYTYTKFIYILWLWYSNKYSLDYWIRYLFCQELASCINNHLVIQMKWDYERAREQIKNVFTWEKRTIIAGLLIHLKVRYSKNNLKMQNEKTTILYIHGFNSGAGKKVEQLKTAGFKVIAPQLKHLNATEDLKQLHQIVEELINNNIDFEIVGTSLGGFYTMCLSSYVYFKGKPFLHCINPSYRPHETLKRVLGEKLINYKTGEPYELKQEFLNSLQTEFEKMQLVIEKNIEKIHFYLGTQDELLDFTEIESLGKHITYSNQNHRFEDISLIIDELKE